MTKFNTKSYLIAMATAVACASSAASAATIYWNAGSGTWNSANTNWSTDSAGASSSVWVDGSDAVFSSDSFSSSTTALAIAVAPQSLTFNDNASITGNYNITLATSGSITVADGVTASINTGASAALKTATSTTLGINVGASSTLSISNIVVYGVNFTGPGTLNLERCDAYVAVNSGMVYTSATSTKIKTVTINGGTFVLNGSMAAATTGISVGANGTYAGATNKTNAGKVTLAGATSIVSPGDMNSSGVSSIGSLTINGLVATSGGTFKYDFNHASNDQILLGANALSLGGTITFDFSGTVDTGTAYALMTGTGTWSGAPTFVFNLDGLQDGITLDSSYGTNGYIWDAANHTLSVQFATVPEVASLGILGFGALAVLARKPRR